MNARVLSRDSVQKFYATQNFQQKYTLDVIRNNLVLVNCQSLFIQLKPTKDHSFYSVSLNFLLKFLSKFDNSRVKVQGMYSMLVLFSNMLYSLENKTSIDYIK